MIADLLLAFAILFVAYVFWTEWNKRNPPPTGLT